MPEIQTYTNEYKTQTETIVLYNTKEALVNKN